MENVLEEVYDDTLVQIDDKGLKPIGRRYGRVSRKLLRDELINRCAKNGVKYYEGLVDSVQNQRDGTKLIRASEGAEFGARVVAMSTGHNREVLEYEEGSPPAWQTAYGIEIDAPDHPWEPNKAVFMDLTQSDDEIITSMGRRIPSFLYVLPSKDKVFIEETCLVSKVQVPFDELKRRLYRRLEKLDFKFDQSQIIEEEASWIPLGGSLPKVPQQVVAFGAAAGLVHPATGYSIINSLKMAEPVAEAIASGLQSDMGAMGSTTASAGAWKAIWGAENRRKMAFYQFGSDLIAKMPLGTLREFMRTFYSLPPNIWKGFLSHRLTSPMLVPLALLMFAYGNDDLRMALVSELASPAGASLIKTIFDAQGAENAAHNEADLLARDEEDADLMIRRVSPLREPLKGVFRREQLSESGPSGFAK
uniref:Lycopene beta-cyclase n=1 Tax=Amorphochlora amoebiformis TaxID=1561963 RepID=A0A7S0D9N0_9EUKA